MKVIRVTPLGDAGCGKTTLLRYIAKLKEIVAGPTIFDNYAICIDHNNRMVTLSLGDSAGHPESKMMRDLIFKMVKVDIVLLCFDITDVQSLQAIVGTWRQEADEFSPNTPRSLVGNKKDLRDVNDTVLSTETIAAVAEQIEAREYVECSGITGEGTEQLVRSIVEIAGERRDIQHCCGIA